eukprot:CAMPEP_0117495406 /NCGR_PEP_ID=MMETSP0784-20121206/20114_1 /TAXON_ID=39447 /ORGANISM="" /LENGTH=471 /DNA_ID=CAMNT_0005290323 /DNA_START=54 /DNA_END=1470 /DNA_ORIENTATION=+
MKLEGSGPHKNGITCKEDGDLAVTSWFGMVLSMATDLLTLQRAYFHFWVRGGSYAEYGTKPYGGSLHAAVHVFSLALELKLWSRPHYRKPSYQADIIDNYRNVAVPGTGIPLSLFARNRIVAAFYLVAVYPVLCFFASFHHAWKLSKNKSMPFPARWAAAFREQLLEPQDWFSFWRINSRVAAWHSVVTSKEGTDYHDYEMENKWDFIKRGLELGVPVSPILKARGIVMKHKNEEGGMGIHFYKNATEGGDWIMQEVISNDDFVSKLLPPNAPLSTFRVMTASLRGAGEGNAEAIACVFRAGRAGAATDHSAVLFDVDIASGHIKRGTRNAQWYVLGPQAWRSCPWGPPRDEINHPDGDGKGGSVVVAGAVVPNWEKIKKVVADAHDKMLPRVPLCGWDVCLTKEHGVCLLEANLSCNFFRGSFDQPKYFSFIDQYHRFCEKQDAAQKKLHLKADCPSTSAARMSPDLAAA